MTRPAQKLLIVEGDPKLAAQLRACLVGIELLIVSNGEDAVAQLRRHEPSAVLFDIGVAEDEPRCQANLDTLQELVRLAPQCKVVAVIGDANRLLAARAVDLGAFDFHFLPIDEQVLRLVVGRALRISELESGNVRLRSTQSVALLEGIIATEASMQKVCRMVEKVAPTNASVLLLGESGTGKELLAKALHSKSERATGRFVAINCAAIPEQLLESELFGYEKGAFTGAAKQTRGKVENADGGTLFLDEIGDMPIALQAKLLRFLQNRVIERVGGRQEISIDVRVICATNQDLQAQIAAQKFRQDLYFRICEVTIQVPPLRQRPGDAVVLAQAMLRRSSDDLPKPPRGFSDKALVAIQRYDWPGNVRELENKVRAAAIMATGPLITAEDLGLGDNTGRFVFLNLKAVRSQAERQAVQQALAITSGNVSQAAELLGVTRPTLYDLMERYECRFPTQE